MTKNPKDKSENKIDLESDAWQRFERAVDLVAKSPPQHRVAKKKKIAPKKSKSKKG